MTAYIRGFGVCGYRSFQELQYIGPFQKINLLVGKNNAGKSNAIRFLCQHLPNYRSWMPSDLDGNRFASTQPYGVAICLPEMSALMESDLASRQVGERELTRLLECAAFRPDPESDATWVRFMPNPNGPTSMVCDVAQADEVLADVGQRYVSNLSSRLTSTSGGAKYDDYNRVMDYILARVQPPPVTFIDAFRQVRPGGEGKDDYDGAGLVERIAMLQNPDALTQVVADRMYRAINKFLSSVLGEEVRLEVPHNKSTVNIRDRYDLMLPLDHYGTGVHQLTILATAATVLEDKLVCIEEPEINLHPTLQRALLRYLYENTSNTYVIATHSAQMLDYERASVLHFEQSETGTKVSVASRPFELARVCYDLGYRPSDLVQANAVIWVEGPSDRTYLNHWIYKAAPNLIEGVHYSVMFYGGALLSELTADDPAVTEFIRLRRLNRHLGIVMDRDGNSKSAPLNKTKERVRAEFAASPEDGFAWVLAGYTIENYVPVDVLRQAVKDVHPGKEISWRGNRWTNPLKGFSNSSSSTRPRKAAIAKRVVAIWDDPFDVKGLREEVDVVLDFIKRANAA